MKIKKLFALTLCLVTVVSSLAFASTASANVYVPSGTGASHASVETVKTVTPNGNNYDVHLEAWVTGEITEATGTQPMDIVLVIDQSKSMLDSMGTVTRQAAMKTAVSYFIGEVAGTADAEMSDHRMAIVTFDDDATLAAGWTDVLTNAGTLTTAVNALRVTNDSPSTTNIESGMSRANTLMTAEYSYSGENAERKKVVVLLTDGVPTVGTEPRFDVEAANAALGVADSMKENGVLVYSIGIFGGAAPAQLCGNQWAHIFGWESPDGCYDVKGNKWGLYWWTGIGDWVFSSFGDVYEFDVPAGNRFLNYISSNYRTTSINLSKADSSSYLGGGSIGWKITENALTPSSSGHYLAADDVEALKNMFSTITTSASKVDIELDENTVLQDVVTEYFDIVGTPTAYALNLSNNTTTALAAEKNGNTVSVTGFDYSKENHFVPQTGTSGQKVVMDFVIAPKADFLGGNGVYTNDVLNSGLVSKGTFVENFAPQQVNVPVKAVTPAVNNQTIYLGNNADVSTLLGDLDSRADGLADRIDGTNNAYVDVIYDVKNANGDVLATYTVYAGNTEGQWSKYAGYNPALTGCTDYTVTCTVNGGTGNTAVTAQANIPTATVHVLKPTITADSATVYLGNTVNTAAMNARVSDWSCTCETPKTAATIGEATQPTYTFEYVKNEQRVSVGDTVFSGCTDVFVIGTLKGQQFESQAVKVHVLKPTITVVGDTIYYGNPANPSASITGWSCTHGESKITEGQKATYTEPTYHYILANDTNANKITDLYFTSCDQVKAVATLAGQPFVSSNSEYIHVVKPTITKTDVTVYLGNSTDLDNRVSDGDNWACSHTSLPAESSPGIKYNFTPTEGNDTVNADSTYAPSDCVEVNFTATVNTVNTVKNFDVTPSSAAFMVHVLHPVITSEDAYIYLGQTANLNGCMTVAETWVDKNVTSGVAALLADHGTGILEGEKPAVDYTFTVNPDAPETVAANDEDKYPAMDCTPVSVTAVAKGTAEKNAAIEEKEANFTVHVLQPTFAVTTQDVWADCGTEVDLTKNGIKFWELGWKDETAGHTTPDTLPAGAPSVSSEPSFTFAGAADEICIVGETDAVFTVPKLTFVLDNGYTADFALADKSFTVHVNTFDLTIKKTWDGAACYKQDAIFTIARDDGEILQVVIPEEQESVVIAGLLCGKGYTVTEENAWTWRWNANSAQTTKHYDHDPITTEAVSKEQSMTFANTLNTAKVYWLDGDIWCENTFGKKKD